MSNKNIALFFDCENISVDYINDIYSELANYGKVIMSKAYANWNNNRNKRWKEKLQEYAIEQIQPNTSDKNSSDIKITIDVMKTICDKRIDIICLISSDSDFTSLAMEVKANALEAIGMGEIKSPNSLRKAFSTFIELPLKKEPLNQDDKLIQILQDAIENQKDESGYILVAEIGTYLKNKDASLIAKNFAFRAWGDAFKKYDSYFEIKYKDKKKSSMLVAIKESYKD